MKRSLIGVAACSVLFYTCNSVLREQQLAEVQAEIRGADAIRDAMPAQEAAIRGEWTRLLHSAPSQSENVRLNLDRLVHTGKLPIEADDSVALRQHSALHVWTVQLRLGGAAKLLAHHKLAAAEDAISGVYSPLSTLDSTRLAAFRNRVATMRDSMASDSLRRAAMVRSANNQKLFGSLREHMEITTRLLRRVAASSPAADIIEYDRYRTWRAQFYELRQSIPPRPPGLQPEQDAIWQEYELGLSYLWQGCEKASEGLDRNSMATLSKAREQLGMGTGLVREAYSLAVQRN